MTTDKAMAEAEWRKELREMAGRIHGADEWSREDVEIELLSLLPALTSHARPAAGFIREATGPDRKVLGTLPVTADGCVAGEGARIIFPQLDGSLNYEYVCARGVLGPIQSGYSTPAAAQAESKETP